MRKASDFQDVVDTVFTQAAKSQTMFRDLESNSIEGRHVQLDGRELLQFGSCSYLGLETDPRLKEGAIAATMRYGTQYSSSRAFASIPLYAEIEEMLEELFGGSVLVTPTTTLGHFAALPVLIREDDAVILDQQVHNSVQMAANLVRVQGTHVEMIRHNRMDILEERIEELRKKHRQIWYLADGIYSMYGDLAPMDELAALLNRYEQFHLYVDDAHGVSWYGKHGRGYALERLPIHERMVVAVSFAKGFGTGGGALVFPEPEMRRRVRNCGGPPIFSGPLQPPMLGALLASARIHLSDEIYERQAALQEKMQLCNRLLMEYGLPVVSPSEAPIRYVGLGLPRVAFNLVNRLMKEGFYANPAPFPVVPMKRSGLRFTLTTHQTLEDIQRFIEAIARNLPETLREEDTSLEEIKASFRRAIPADYLQPVTELTRRVASRQDERLFLQHETTIERIDFAEWDFLLGKNGSFSWDGLRFLESAFRGQAKIENDWNFHYYLVRDDCGKAILATFFTDALWKDDMISPEHTSALVEQKRILDPYFLTSRTLGMGCSLTEGNHLYLDRAADWKGALFLLLKAIEAERECVQATQLVLRDLPSDDPEMDEFLLEQGFTKFPMPESLVIDLTWKDEEEFLLRLSQRSRRHQLRQVIPSRPAFETEVIQYGGRAPTDEEFDHLYGLYRNVKSRGLLINTFDLPREIFRRMLEHPGWELLTLTLRPEFGATDGLPVAFCAAYQGSEHYVPLVGGLDYRFVESHHSYRCLLDVCVRRAERLGAKRIHFGFGAALEKQRFGARARVHSLYVQASDHYNLDLLAQLMNESAGLTGKRSLRAGA